MSRSLATIKAELSTRIQSEEYVPTFVERTDDFISFADSVGEFIAPYVKQLEDMLEIWTNATLLRIFLLKRGMYLSGSEVLGDLQTIAQDRIKILSRRGTISMLEEIQRLVNESTLTDLVHKDFGTVGWVLGRTSPCYRDSNTEYNYSYLNLRKAVVFKIKNETLTLTNEKIKSILNYYFKPRHIKSLYYFL